MNKRTKYLLPALLIVCGVYAFFLSNNWAWDDTLFIEKNINLRNFTNASKLFSKEYFSISKEASYRPLSTFIYFVTFKIFGQSPFYFHLSNLILHLFTVAGVYFMVLKLSGSPPTAFAASLVFGLHPANAEAVFCACYNKDLMATLGIVWLFVLRIGHSYKDKWKTSTFVTAALLCLMCLFSKETGLTFILLLFVYDITFKKDEITSRNAKIFYSLVLTLTLFYLFVRFRVFAGPSSSGQYFGGTFLTNILNLPGIMLNYFRLFVVPVPLSVEHVMEAATRFRFDVVSACAVFLCACVVFLVFGKRDKVYLFSFLWVLISFVPVMNMVPFLHRIFWAERYMYLGSVGFSMGLAYLFYKSFIQNSKIQKLARVCLILVLTCYSGIVFGRGMNWRDAKTLYLNDLKVSPNGFALNCAVAQVYISENDYYTAIKYYEKILANKPASKLENRTVPYINLSRLYILTNDNTSAVRTAEKGLAVLPEERAELLANLAVAKYNLGDVEEAVKLNKKALSLNDLPVIRYNLGLSYYKAGYFNFAEESLEKVKSNLPLCIDLFSTLKSIYTRNGESGKLREIEKDIQEIKKNPGAYSGMATFMENL